MVVGVMGNGRDVLICVAEAGGGAGAGGEEGEGDGAEGGYDEDEGGVGDGFGASGGRVAVYYSCEDMLDLEFQITFGNTYHVRPLSWYQPNQSPLRRWRRSCNSSVAVI